jgi:ABC-type phosphate transport system substrate-binding protein
MASFSVRRFPAFVLTATAAVALAAPGVAQAKKENLCESTVKTIQGAGSTLQKTAQVSVWNLGFEKATSGNAASCKGSITIKPWNNIGSGPGLEKWGLEGVFDPTTDYVATDEAPNVTQKGKMEVAGGGAPLNTYPVAQAALALLVHLPEECEAESTLHPAPNGRLVFTNKALNELWLGQIKTWGELATRNGNGDKVFATTKKVTAKTSEECEQALITRYVREEGSGTTHIFKKYLGVINKATTFEAENVHTSTPVGPKTWSEPGNGIAEEKLNNEVWPTADKVIFAGDNGGGALVEKTLNNPSSVGYAALTDARAKSGKLASGEKDKFAPIAGGSGGPGTSTFWVPLENGAGSFADPSEDNDTSEGATKSNCLTVEYTNGTKTFPPKKTTLAWNEVTTKLTEPGYTLCGLTFDLGYTPYKTPPFGAQPEAEEIEDSVCAYYKYILNTAPEGGQPEIGNKHDYEALPANLIAIADKGLKKCV